MEGGFIQTEGKERLTDQSYWDRRYRSHSYNLSGSVPFSELFDQLIPDGNGRKCLEIGCYPGRFLLYFAKKGYVPYGLDFTEELPKMRGYFSQYGILNLTMIRCDFNKYESSEQFDIVCSFGFIEHFKNYNEILEKHIALVKPGGYLIISCPNFTHIQYKLHYLLDRKNLSIHEISAMDLKKWEIILLKNNMELLYHDYYMTAGFWVDDRERNVIKKTCGKGIAYSFFLLDKLIDHPNAYISPYMISISKKSELSL